MKKILLIILLFAFTAIQAQDKPPTGSNFVLVGNSVYFNKTDQTLWLYKSKPLGWTQIATSKNVKFKLDSIMSLISSTAPVYPVSGIAVSSGTSWATSIVDNSTLWNSAWYSGNHPTVFADYGLTGGILTTPLIGTEIRMTGEENYATADFFTYNGDGTGAYGVSVISYIGANRKLFKVGFDTGNDDGFMVDWDHPTARFKYKFNLGDILLNGDISAVNETLTGDLAGTSMSMVAPLGTASVTGWTWNGDAESVYGTNAIGYLGANRKIFRVGTYLGSNGFTVDWLHDAGRFAYNFNIGDANVSGNVTATSFVKSGGTSSEILMADGSISARSAFIWNQTDSPQTGGAWTTSAIKVGSTTLNTTYDTYGILAQGTDLSIFADEGRKVTIYADGFSVLKVLANHNVEIMGSILSYDDYGFAIGNCLNYRRITYDNYTNTFRALSTANLGAIFSASKFISDATTGISPLTVSSTTLVDNLNADLLDGQHGSYYSDYTNLINKPYIPDESNLVHMSGTETITGQKTFNQSISQTSLPTSGLTNLLTQTVGSGSHQTVGAFNSVTYSGSDNESSVYGKKNYAYLNTTGTVAYAYGDRTTIFNNGGILTNGEGVEGNVINNSGTLTTGYATVGNVTVSGGKFNKIVGVYSNVSNTSSDVTNNDTYGFYSNFHNSGVFDGYAGLQIDAYNTGTARIMTGLQVDFWTAGGITQELRGIDIGVTHPWTGTPTNAYGIYIDASTNIGTSINYAIYSGSTAPSSFAGIINTTGLTILTGAGSGKVWTSDDLGVGSWVTPTGGATSGTYTPNAINIANTSAHWIESASYIRVGKIVHCQVDGTVVASSANTDTILAIDLPIVSTISQTGVLLGVGSLININNSNPNPSVDVSRTSGYAQMYFSYKSTSAGDQVSFSIQFDYQL